MAEENVKSKISMSRKILDIFLISSSTIVFCFCAHFVLVPNWYWWKKETKLFRDIPCIELYSYKTEESIRIYDRNDIDALWQAMDVISETKESPEFNSGQWIAYVTYPMPDCNGGYWEDGEPAFPVYIFPDGTILRGIPPDDDKYAYRPDYRDTVIKLCEKYGLDIDWDNEKQ